MVLAYLINKKRSLKNAELLGAAYKPYSLGFLYKVNFKLETAQLVTSEVYIEVYSDKISIKNFFQLKFDTELMEVNTQEDTITKIVAFLKSGKISEDFTTKQSFAKDFLYGTLYKLILVINSEEIAFYVYHDHSTEDINLIFTKVIDEKDHCMYDSEQVCTLCDNDEFNLVDGVCVEKVKNCQIEEEGKCILCTNECSLINQICVEKATYISIFEAIKM